jgi:hypothetical protein
MTNIGKYLLSISILLLLTACHERRVEPSVPLETLLKNTLNTSTETEETSSEIPTIESEENEVILPILDIVPEESTTYSVTQQSTDKKIFKGGIITDGLDMKTVRASQNDERSRLVFDSYLSNEKAAQSGNYTFTYNPSKKQITAVINGYRKLSALNGRTFSDTNIVKNIKKESYLDDSGFKFTINLKHSASVNVFELKFPARIVVDITPN